jgi:hypothetical protein
VSDRQIGLSRPQPKRTACQPTLSEARVDRQSAVNQFDGGVDIIVEIAESKGGAMKDIRIIAADLQRLPG